MTTMHTKLWEPTPERIAQANITAFAALIEAKHHVDVDTYARLWQWSVDHKWDFWREVWDYGGVLGTPGERVLLDADRMPGARWFPDARLNFAQNLLERRRADDADDALVFWGEDKVRRVLSHADLHALASRVAAAFAAHGVKAGDRVAAYLPNMPEAIVAMLGAAANGAIWSSCSPDFGVQGVVDRFAQIEPRVLVTVDGYWYNGKPIPILDKVAEIVGRLPSVERVVVVPYLAQTAGTPDDLSGVRGAVAWDVWLAPFLAGPIDYVALPFEHPLYILYSSGTTGVPKCIVHSAGGTLLQHLKEHLLHGDVKPRDRVFYFTTCGWMMWNWLVSALAARATLLLYDGSPFIDRGRILWQLADTERMTHFGTSAKYIDAQKKIALVPRKDWSLATVRTMFSTGSPLSPESFDYVYQCVKDDLCLSSISGGTDIVSCFALGTPTLPVYRGEIQCRGLGMDVDVYDENGHPLVREKGELVCKSPFPSMPVAFWNDPDGAKLSRRLLRALPRDLVPRRLGRDHRARRARHLRTVRRDAQSGRRAHRHRRDLPAGRAAARDRREPRHRPGLAARRGRRRARRAVREAGGGRRADRRARRAHQDAHSREHDAAARAGEGRAGDRHSAHQERQDRRARRAQRRARARRPQRRGARQSRGARGVPRPARAQGLAEGRS